jgi:hypothetical protein
MVGSIVLWLFYSLSLSSVVNFSSFLVGERAGDVWFHIYIHHPYIHHIYIYIYY